jgi:hypothetical protein
VIEKILIMDADLKAKKRSKDITGQILIMVITFGEHKGKSVELIMLKEPSYVKWVLDQLNPPGALLPVKNEIHLANTCSLLKLKISD